MKTTITLLFLSTALAAPAFAKGQYAGVNCKELLTDASRKACFHERIWEDRSPKTPTKPVNMFDIKPTPPATPKELRTPSEAEKK